MKIQLPNKPTIKRMDVASIYNVHPNTIARWEQANKFPKGHKPAGDKGHVHYWTEDIKDHIEKLGASRHLILTGHRVKVLVGKE